MSSDCTRSKDCVSRRTAYVSLHCKPGTSRHSVHRQIMCQSSTDASTIALRIRTRITKRFLLNLFLLGTETHTFLGGKAQDHMVVLYVAKVTRGIGDTQASTVGLAFSIELLTEPSY